ncbi:hypothetical protein TCAL_10309, partial [Tigriopus californicus]|eukprot:TCALIF_10309-PA protein Name:"Protein of unknown function" AED:0.01 eAED:0.01 QI:34/1/0.5/1/0/0/2/0/95
MKEFVNSSKLAFPEHTTDIGTVRHAVRTVGGRCQGSNPKSEPLASSFFEMYEAFCFHLHLFEVSRQQQQQQQHRTGEMKKDLSLPMFEYIRPEKQ